MFDHGAGVALGFVVLVKAKPARLKPCLCCGESPIHVRGETVVHVLNGHVVTSDRLVSGCTV
jgi:hypothetical protein